MQARYCRKCDRVLTGGSFPIAHGVVQGQCLECRGKVQKDSAAGLRLRAIECLGSVCLRCSCDDPDVLTFDHIAGNGAEDRRLNGPHTRRVAKAILGGSTEYQLLCANCNWKKRLQEDPPSRAGRGVMVIPENHPDAIAVRASLGKHPNHWSTDPEKTLTIGQKISASYSDPNSKSGSEEHRRKISEARRAVGNEILRLQADERNQKRDAQILALRSQNHTYDQIAAIVGCSKPTVGKVITRNGGHGKLGSPTLMSERSTITIS